MNKIKSVDGRQNMQPLGAGGASVTTADGPESQITEEMRAQLPPDLAARYGVLLSYLSLGLRNGKNIEINYGV